MEKREFLKNSDFLFHYTSMAVGLEKILFTQELKFSQSSETNDPKEYKDFFLEPYMDGEGDLSKLRKNAEKALLKELKKYRFACFCNNEKKNDRFGYQRFRMWSQYGGSFRGVCIVFSKEELEKEIKKQVCSQNVFIQNISYENLNKEGGKTRCMNLNGDKEKNEIYIKEFVLEKKSFFFFSKDKDYRDENESRLLIYDPEQEYEFLKVGNSIKAVLLGDRSEEVYCRRIEELCNKVGAKCYRTSWFKEDLFVEGL